MFALLTGALQHVTLNRSLKTHLTVYIQYLDAFNPACHIHISAVKLQSSSEMCGQHSFPRPVL